MTDKHWHHIIPRHAGGTDEPLNLVQLTLEEHTEAHRKLYEEFGRWQDKMAWEMMSGRKVSENARKMAAILGQQALMNDPVRLEQVRQTRINGVLKWYEDGAITWNKGLLLKEHPDHPGLKKISENTKRQQAEGRAACVGDWARGKEFDENHRANLSKKAFARSKVTCEHCSVAHVPGMYARWHGNKCKMKS